MNPLSVFQVQTWCVVFPAWQADGGLQVFPAGNGLQWVHFTCGGFFLTFRFFLLKLMQVSVSPCVSVPRDMSCDNLALCLPCPNLSVAYVKDRRLSGGPGTLLPVHLWPPTAALFDGMGILFFFLILFFNQSWSWIQSFFRAVLKLLLLLPSFLVVYFLLSRTLKPIIFVLSKYFFLLWKNILPSLPFSILLPLHFQFCSLHGLPLALSKAFKIKFCTHGHTVSLFDRQKWGFLTTLIHIHTT